MLFTVGSIRGKKADERNFKCMLRNCKVTSRKGDKGNQRGQAESECSEAAVDLKSKALIKEAALSKMSPYYQSRKESFTFSLASEKHKTHKMCGSVRIKVFLWQQSFRRIIVFH